MYYTLKDFLAMDNETLRAFWDNGIYLNPDEMELYIKVCEYREIEL